VKMIKIASIVVAVKRETVPIAMTANAIVLQHGRAKSPKVAVIESILLLLLESLVVVIHVVVRAVQVEQVVAIAVQVGVQATRLLAVDDIHSPKSAVGVRGSAPHEEFIIKWDLHNLEFINFLVHGTHSGSNIRVMF
jgi:hypothetical protein